MKYDQLLRGLALLMMVAIVATGCNKDEDPPNPEDFQGLSFDADAVLDMVPAGLKNSTDQYAQDCFDNIESAVDMSSFIDMMEVPEGATKSNFKSSGDTWQWSWSYGGESFTFYWSYEESGGKKRWSMDIQYGNGPRYNYIDAWETTDGKQGEVVYNFAWAAAADGETLEDGDFVYWRYTWMENSSGAYTLNFIWDADDPEYEIFNEYEVVINADGSGDINYYFLDALYYHMEWDVLGNGLWVYYSEGVEFLSGSWVAG